MSVVVAAAALLSSFVADCGQHFAVRIVTTGEGPVLDQTISMFSGSTPSDYS